MQYRLGVAELKRRLWRKSPQYDAGVKALTAVRLAVMAQPALCNMQASHCWPQAIILGHALSSAVCIWYPCLACYSRAWLSTSRPQMQMTAEAWLSRREAVCKCSVKSAGWRRQHQKR
jgi:hypothetical protein